MLSNYQITELVTRELPESSWAEVNRRLRFEPTVWTACGEEEIITGLLQRPNSEQIEQWNPIMMGLAILAITQPETTPDPEAWLTDTEAGRSRLASAHERLFTMPKNGDPSSTTEDIKLAIKTIIDSTIESVALRESTKNSSNEALDSICDAAQDNMQCWATPLTYLYGLLDDPKPMMLSLLDIGSTEAAHVVTRVWLANESPNDIPHLLETIVPALDTGLQLAIGQAFTDNGLSHLAQVVGITAAPSSVPKIPSTHDARNLPAVTKTILRGAESGLLRILAEDDAALSDLSEALQGAQILAAELALQLGNAQMKKGDAVSALAAFEQAHMLSLQENNTRSLIAEARIALDQPEHARTLLTRSADHSSRTLLALARAQSASGDFIMAEETACQAIDGAADRETLLGCARVLSDSGAAAAAAHALDQAVKLLPSSSRILSWQSRELMRCGQLVEAREAAYEAVALNPDAVEARVTLGQALSSSISSVEQENEQALVQWKRAVELDPEYAPSLLGFAKCALEIDKPRQARELAEKILRSRQAEDISQEEIDFIGEAHTVIGRAAAALGNPDEAMGHFEQAAAFAPNSPEPWLAMAQHHRCHDNLDHALAALESGLQSVSKQHPSKTVSLWVDTGILKAQMGRQEEAVDALRKAVRLKPTNGPIHRKLGNMLHQQGHFPQAVEALQQAAKYLPADKEIWHELALANEAAGESEEALIAYQRAQNSGQKDTSLSRNLGKLAFRLGKHDLARPNLASAAHDDSADIETLIMLGEALEETGETEQALDAYQRAIQLEPGRHDLLARLGSCCLKLKLPEIAIAALASPADNDRDNLSLQRIIGEAYIQAGLWDEAIRALEQATRIAPEDTQIARLLAQAAHQGGHPQRAIETLLQATRQGPNDASLQIDLAQSYCREKQWEDAKIAIERAVELNPNEASHLLALSDCLISMDDITKAIQILERAALLKPQDQRVLTALAEAHSKAANHEAAHNVFIRAATLPSANTNSEMNDYRANRAFNLRRAGESLWALQDKDQAIHLWKKALRDAPGDVSVQWQLGDALMSRGQHTEALEAFEAAAREDPANPNFALAAAEAAVVLGELKRAQHHLKPITQSRLETSEPNYRLGRIYLSMGQNDKALAAFRRACDINPDDGRYLASTAKALLVIGALEDAASMAQRALSSDPDNIDILKTVGTVLVNTGRLTKGLDALEHVLKSNLSDASIQIEIAKDLVLDAEKHHQHHKPVADQGHTSRRDALIDESIRRAADLHGDPEEIQEWRGRAMVLAGEAKTAIPLLEPLVHKRPNPGLRCALATAYCIAGDFKRAKQEVEQVQKHDPSDLTSLIVSSRIDAAQGNIEAEIQTLHRASQFSPQDPIPYYLLGEALFKSNETERGRDALSHALQLNPNQASWHFSMAELLQSLDEADSALVHYQKAVHLAEEQDLPISNSAEYSAALGRSHYDDGDFSAARQAYDKAVNLMPDRHDWQTATGQACLDTAKPDEAIEYFTRASKLNPEDPEPLIGGMRALMSLGRANEAEEHALAALKLDPDNSHALLAIGELFAARGDHANALASLDQAIQYAGDPRQPLLAKVRVMMELGLREQAVPHLKQALELDDKDHTAWGLAGDLYVEIDNPDDAHKAYGSASNIAPLVARYHIKLGQLCRLSSHLDEALVHLNKAADLDLNDQEQSEVHAGIGQIFEERGQFYRAYKAYSIAIKHQPDEAWNHLRAGVTLKQLKDYDAAIAMFEHAIELDPKNIDARRQLAVVSALELVNGVAA